MAAQRPGGCAFVQMCMFAGSGQVPDVPCFLAPRGMGFLSRPLIPVWSATD